MADMIFPTTKQEELASEKVFNGIDWDAVVTSMTNKETEDKPKLPENFSDLIAEKYAEEDAETRTAGKLPEALEQYKFKKADEKEAEKDECACGGAGCEKCEEKTEKKATRLRKIRFTSASQLSAEALDAAREAGDEDLVKAILAARQDRRVRLASKIEEASKEQEDVNEKLAQRQAYRQKIVEQHMSKIAAAKKASVKITVAEKKEDTGFKVVANMTSSEKKAFASKALANGFPESYVNEMLGMTETTPEVSGAEKEVRELMASSLSEDTKRTAIASLVKTASLTGDQISRCMKYWTEELGYDKDWAAKLFKTTYEKNPGGSEEKAEGAEA